MNPFRFKIIAIESQRPHDLLWEKPTALAQTNRVLPDLSKVPSTLAWTDETSDPP